MEKMTQPVELTSGFSKKYLLDECVTIHQPFAEHSLFVNSVDVVELGHGAKDEQIGKYAQKYNFATLTEDKRFCLELALRGQPVYYMCKKRRVPFEIVAFPREELMKYVGDKTYYILENDSIVLS